LRHFGGRDIAGCVGAILAARHVSAEPAHAALLDRIEKKPVMDFGVNIGDGSGGALAISLLKLAAAGLKTL